jgi:hypothetical protein
MTGDVSQRRPEPGSTGPRPLPDIVTVEIRHARYKEPIRTYVTPVEIAEYGEAIEFELTTSAELPIRAYPPVLYVGDVVVPDFQQLERERYIFRAYDPSGLTEGAPIALGWPNDREGRRATSFRYERPPEAGSTRSRPR